MKKENVADIDFMEVEIKDKHGIFTELRVDKSSVPDNLYLYELRHGDDDGFPITLEKSAFVNYFGAVLLAEEVELTEKDFLELEYEDFGFTGDEMSVEEYIATYKENPTIISNAKELVEFSGRLLSEREAEILLGYMEGHDYKFGTKGNDLFRGDFSYLDGIIRWEKDSILIAVNAVAQWNAELQLESEKNRSEDSKKTMENLKIDEAIIDKMFDYASRKSPIVSKRHGR